MAKKLSEPQVKALRGLAEKKAIVKSTNRTYNIIEEGGYATSDRTLTAGGWYKIYVIADAGRDYLRQLDTPKTVDCESATVDISADTTSVTTSYYAGIAALNMAVYRATTQHEIDTLKAAIEAMERRHFVTEVEDGLVAMTPDPKRQTEEIPVVHTDRVIIPVTVVTEEDPAQLRTVIAQLKLDLHSANTRADSYFFKWSELQKAALARQLETPTAPVIEDEPLTDEITIKRVQSGFNSKALLISGHYTEDIEGGTANATNLIGNIQAWQEHKVLFLLAGHGTMNYEALKGVRILASKGAEKRVTAVKGKSGEWFTSALTDKLTTGMVTVNRTTETRKTVKAVKKDMTPRDMNGFIGTPHYTVIFEDGSQEYASDTKRWYLVYDPAAAIEKLAA